MSMGMKRLMSLLRNTGINLEVIPQPAIALVSGVLLKLAGSQWQVWIRLSRPRPSAAQADAALVLYPTRKTSREKPHYKDEMLAHLGFCSPSSHSKREMLTFTLPPPAGVKTLCCWCKPGSKPPKLPFDRSDLGERSCLTLQVEYCASRRTERRVFGEWGRNHDDLGREERNMGSVFVWLEHVREGDTGLLTSPNEWLASLEHKVSRVWWTQLKAH